MASRESFLEQHYSAQLLALSLGLEEPSLLFPSPMMEVAGLEVLRHSYHLMMKPWALFYLDLEEVEVEGFWMECEVVEVELEVAEGQLEVVPGELGVVEKMLEVAQGEEVEGVARCVIQQAVLELEVYQEVAEVEGTL